MTPSARRNAESAGRQALRTGRWQWPGGSLASEPVRDTIRDALRRWGLGPVAGELTDRLTTLVQELLAHSGRRGRGSIDMRLELRAPARLLLGEVHHTPLPAGGARDRPAGGRGIIAVTYGRRPAREGTEYVRSFSWWRSEEAPGGP